MTFFYNRALGNIETRNVKEYERAKVSLKGAVLSLLTQKKFTESARRDFDRTYCSLIYTIVFRFSAFIIISYGGVDDNTIIIREQRSARATGFVPLRSTRTRRGSHSYLYYLQLQRAMYLL